MLKEIEPSVLIPSVDDLIYVFDDVIPKDFCNYLIKKFEDDSENQVEGMTGLGKQTNVKVTTDIHLVGNEKWFEDTNEVLNYTNLCVEKYYNIMGSIQFFMQNVDYGSIIFAKYPIGGFFNWHVDATFPDESRIFQIIVYLNDVESGGETEYPVFGAKIKPKVGRVVIAPCSYPFFHKSHPTISGSKYNIIIQVKQVNRQNF